MNVKVVFHIDFDMEDRLAMAIGNFKNLLREISAEGSSLCIVANGSSVKLFQKPAVSAHADDINDLSAQGVRFFVCNNSLNKFELTLEEMHPSCEVVKAGVLKLIELQGEGYAYIKP